MNDPAHAAALPRSSQSPAPAARVDWDHKIGPEGLTFDDVLLVPCYAERHPSQVDVRSQFSRRVTLNIPIVSSAMDTVTETSLAIALAREGGIGVIHKNLTIAEQSAQVDRVKRSESGMIEDPVALPPNATVGEAHAIMARFHISGVPITEHGKLVGILTNRDLRFEHQMQRRVSEVMTRDRLITVPVGTSLEQAREILAQHRIEKLPVVDEQGRPQGSDHREGHREAHPPSARLQGRARPAARRRRRLAPAVMRSSAPPSSCARAWTRSSSTARTPTRRA
jgi:IMP dehydrogenase/GMP reductase